MLDRHCGTVWSARCSPLPTWLGPQRLRPPPIALDDLPAITHVVISHNHYDHLDLNTVCQLQQRFRPHFLVPAGLAQWFRRNVDADVRVTECVWWQTVEDAAGAVRLTLVPAQHWSKRTLTDTNSTLWGGWVIQAAGRCVYFAGDTGYCRAFAQIGDAFGPVDLALIPIGACHPRDFMRPQHVDPAEAMQIHRDVRARRSVGIHWGTFVLSNEPIDFPPTELARVCAQQHLPADAFVVLSVGGTTRVP